MSSRPNDLFERDHALDTIAAGMERAAEGAGCLLVLDGPAGIGKTELVRWAAANGTTRGLNVLVGRGAQLEQEFAFGVTRQLFAPVLASAGEAERETLLRGAAAIAEPVLEPPTEGAGVTPSAALHGLHWLASNLAENGPLALCVDDAHWADVSSLRFLAYLADRIDELPALLLVATRSEEADAFAPGLRELTSRPGGAVQLPALSVESAAEMLRRGLDQAPEPEFSHVCWAATAGNPFLLGELVSALDAEGIEPTADRARYVEHLAPETIGRAVLLRVARLDPGAAQLARASAVLPPGSPLRHAAMLADLDEAAAAAAADALRAAKVLDPGTALDFIHPIVRAALYDTIGPSTRAVMHRRAASTLQAEGAPPEQVAAHLVQAEPAGREEVVQALRESAAVALRRGAPEAAARYLSRALEEPPSPATQPHVRQELGLSLFYFADPDAPEHLRSALEGLADPVARARTGHSLGLALAYAMRLEEAVAALRAAVKDAAGVDRELALEVGADLIGTGQMDVSSTAEVAEWSRPLTAGSLTAESPGSRALLAVMAFEAVRTNRPAAEAADLAERALADRRLIVERGVESPSVFFAIYVLILCDRLDDALDHADFAIEEARSRGSAGGFGAASLCRAAAQYRRGSLVDMEQAASDALRVGAFPLGPVLAAQWLGPGRVDRGDLEGAARALEAAGLAEDVPCTQAGVRGPLVARGRLRLIRGNLAGALEDFLAEGAWSERLGHHYPPDLPWRSGAALAHLALGEQEEALRLADEEVQLARAFGTAQPMGIALRAAGMVRGGEEGLELLREAVSTLETSPGRLEHARALIDLGAALRRGNRRAEARERLREGLQLAEGCPAEGLAQRAREELQVAGARPRRKALSGREALTPSELRVAGMAAQGLTNREIAQALFVTMKTVSYHLGNAYQKLDVGSREDLPRALHG